MLMIVPWAAVIIAALFAGLWYRVRRWLIGVTALLWGLYGVYEMLIYYRVLCSG